MNFTWDAQKATANEKKHGVSFELAARVFADPFALTYQGRIENSEYRWQTVGLVDGYLVLLVAHTLEENNDNTEIIRIISARRADSKERTRYEQTIR
jgi:uncharacterized DUF497 family protein